MDMVKSDRLLTSVVSASPLKMMTAASAAAARKPETLRRRAYVVSGLVDHMVEIRRCQLARESTDDGCQQYQ
jgi:hypothetical protein